MFSSVDGMTRPRIFTTRAEFQDRLFEAPGDLRECGDEEIAERMPLEIGAISVESILEKLIHQRFVVSQRHDAVPDVARRWNVVLAPNSTRTAAVVRHRHDRGNVDVVLLETAQQIGKTSASPDGDNIEIRHVRSKSMVGNNLRDRLPHGGQRENRADHGMAQLPETEAEHGDAGNDQHELAIRVRDELEGQGSDNRRTWIRAASSSCDRPT